MSIKYKCEWCGNETHEVEYVARACDTLMVCHNCATHLAPYWYEAIALAIKSLFKGKTRPKSFKDDLF